MLMALTEKDEKIYAYDALKKDKDGNKIFYHCPSCDERVILRQGTKNIHHFAHQKGSDCSMTSVAGGESPKHDALKRDIKKIIERDNNCITSELEYNIGNRIADYYCMIKLKGGIANIKKVAVECVHRHTDIDEFRAKNEYYSNKGIYVLWLFNGDRFIKREKGKYYWKNEVRINEILKEAHTMYFGKIYCLSHIDDHVYAMHFAPVERYNEFKGYSYFLKRTKFLHPKKIENFKINDFIKKQKDKYLDFNRNSAQPKMPRWWQNTYKN